MAKNGMKKFLNIIGFGDDSDEYYEEPAYAQLPRSSSPDKKKSAPLSGGSVRSTGYSSRERNPVRAPEGRGSIKMPGAAAALDGSVRMVVLQPQSVEDTQTVIDNLRQGKPVIVNLETLNKDAAQRLLDFISGAIYALQGEVRKVSRGIFLLAPKGVDISGNIASSFASTFRKNETASQR